MIARSTTVGSVSLQHVVRKLLAVTMGLAAVWSGHVQAQPLLGVLRVGDGSVALSGTSAQTNIDEYLVTSPTTATLVTSVNVSALAMGNQSLTGVFLGAEIANERTRAMIGRHIEDVGAGRLQVLVDRTYPLSEAAAAHAFLESRQAVGRVVLVP